MSKGPSVAMRDEAMRLARRGLSATQIRLEMQELAAEAASYAVAWAEEEDRRQEEDRRREIGEAWAEDYARYGAGEEG